VASECHQHCRWREIVQAKWPRSFHEKARTDKKTTTSTTALSPSNGAAAAAAAAAVGLCCQIRAALAISDEVKYIADRRWLSVLPLTLTSSDGHISDRE